MIQTLEKKQVLSLAEVRPKNGTIVVPEFCDFTVVNFQGRDLPSSPHLRFRLKKQSSLTLWNLYFGDQTAALDMEIIFEEPDAKCFNHTVFFGRGKGSLQFSIKHSHDAPGGISRIFSNGILDDEAFCRYDGLIRIDQTGAGTDASLHEKTLLLSDRAKADAVPGLEIGTNDVKASHSAGMTRIDEEQLFYAASRGMEEKEAVAMIAEGFLEHALRDLPSSSVSQKVSRLVHQFLWI